ncbi:hypothetical protein [Agrobacterium rubi]|uniref:hypothetical protein n=1 Tax=Agrobacterium rubi TaxID=28099 RepID=UPI001574ACC4|nr:hypothetical protein [Agrobacterium rubi]NTE87200.1 hypothetical protein [Agrobacterium rubi]NTF03134.1 hypothetical protein [Agrobacterium rubi]
MTDVLLTKAYMSKDAGTIMTEVPVNEANAIEALGLGEKIKEPAKVEAKGKGEKAVTE